MKRKLFRWLLAAMCACLAACAIITVNVYFPEKAVKEAYKSLDDMMLKNSGDKAPAADTATPPAEPPKQPDAKPQSGLFNEVPSFSLCPDVFAGDATADDLAVEVASMPDVVRAYDEMNRRLPRISALFDSGATGLSSQGLVVARDRSKLAAQDDALISQENQNRKTVVTGMARAILKINKAKESRAALDQVMGKAAATYAETKRENAKSGWWIQLQNGRWLQK